MRVVDITVRPALRKLQLLRLPFKYVSFFTRILVWNSSEHIKGPVVNMFESCITTHHHISQIASGDDKVD